MTGFIIVCAVMLVAAVVVFAYPLLRPVASAAKGQPALPAATIPAVAIGLVLALGSVAIYRQASNFPWGDPRLAEPVPAGHGGDATAASMEDITRQLEARLKDNPNDAEGWRMMARTYLAVGRPKDAVGAYEKAIAIVGDADPGLKIDLAEAMILTEEPPLTAKARVIIDAALAADPTSQKALWYSGVMAYRESDNETAKVRWSKLLEQNPPPEIRQIIEQQLLAIGGNVPATAGQQAAMGDGDATATASQGRTIRVSVTVDPALKDKLKPGTPLFVSAREPGIPGPPLAAVRMTTDELPATVVLSDANAMVDGRNLSSVNDVEIIARVAFGGSAVIASGDLIGTAIQKKGGPGELAVAISKVQP